MTTEALKSYPMNEHFLRWRAQSLAGQGRLEEAIELLERLGKDIPWYALADLASYSFLLERVEKAWTLAVAAAPEDGQGQSVGTDGQDIACSQQDGYRHVPPGFGFKHPTRATVAHQAASSSS